MEYVVVFSKITQFALILLSTFNAPIAFADDTFIYDIFAVDQTTKLPIEDVLITYEFKDVKTGKTDTTSCKTTNAGICTISATVSSSIFSGSHIEGIFRVQKDGYRKEFRSSEKRISNKKFDRTFFLTSNDTPNEYSLVFYKDLIDIKDDDLETIATLTTKPAHKPTGEILPSLHFVRAHIDKKTSAATYQIYILSTYISDSFRSFNIAKFQTPSGPKAVPITNIDKMLIALT